MGVAATDPTIQAIIQALMQSAPAQLALRAAPTIAAGPQTNIPPEGLIQGMRTLPAQGLGGGANGPVTPPIGLSQEQLLEMVLKNNPALAMAKQGVGAGMVPGVDPAPMPAGPNPIQTHIVDPAKRWLGLAPPVAPPEAAPAGPVGPTPLDQLRAALEGPKGPQTIELPGTGRAGVPMPPGIPLPPKQDFSDLRAQIAADKPTPMAQEARPGSGEDVWNNMMIALGSADWSEGAGPGLLQVAGNVAKLRRQDQMVNREEQRYDRRERRMDEREQRQDRRQDVQNEFQIRRMERQDEMDRLRIQAENQNMRYKAELENASRQGIKPHGIEGGNFVYSATGPDGKMTLHVQPLQGIGSATKLGGTVLALGGSKETADQVAAAGVGPQSPMYIPMIAVQKLDSDPKGQDLWRGTEKKIAEITQQVLSQHPGLPSKAIEDMQVGAIKAYKAQLLMSSPKLQQRAFEILGWAKPAGMP